MNGLEQPVLCKKQVDMERKKVQVLQNELEATRRRAEAAELLGRRQAEQVRVLGDALEAQRKQLHDLKSTLKAKTRRTSQAVKAKLDDAAEGMEALQVELADAHVELSVLKVENVALRVDQEQQRQVIDQLRTQLAEEEWTRKALETGLMAKVESSNAAPAAGVPRAGLQGIVQGLEAMEVAVDKASAAEELREERRKSAIQILENLEERLSTIENSGASSKKVVVMMAPPPGRAPMGMRRRGTGVPVSMKQVRDSIAINRANLARGHSSSHGMVALQEEQSRQVGSGRRARDSMVMHVKKKATPRRPSRAPKRAETDNVLRLTPKTPK